MADIFKPIKITSDKIIALPVKNGQVIFVTDTKQVYIDNENKREEYCPAPKVVHYIYDSLAGKYRDMYDTANIFTSDLNIIKTNNYIIIKGTIYIEKTANKGFGNFVYGCGVYITLPELADIHRPDWIAVGTSGEIVTDTLSSQKFSVDISIGLDESDSGALLIVSSDASTDAIETRYAVPVNIMLCKNYITK